jgi:hypothetical protein
MLSQPVPPYAGLVTGLRDAAVGPRYGAIDTPEAVILPAEVCGPSGVDQVVDCANPLREITLPARRSRVVATCGTPLDFSLSKESYQS